MKNTISRTITNTRIHTAYITFENGVPVVNAFEPILVYGSVTQRDAMKIARKEIGKDFNFVITKIEEFDVVYEMEVDDFVRHANAVEIGAMKTV